MRGRLAAFAVVLPEVLQVGRAIDRSIADVAAALRPT